MSSHHPIFVPPSTTHNSTTKIIIIAVVVLLLAVLILIGLRLYAKWFWRRSNHQHAWPWRSPRHHGQELNTAGLDKAVVESLPAFTYKDRANDGLECAICLCEFQEHEKGRSLPNCSHSFHTHCIDVWFLSHTTCPLCRTSAQPATVGEAQHAGQEPDELEHSGAFFQSQTEGGDTIRVVQPSHHIEGLICVELSLDSRSRSPQSPEVEFPTNVLFWGDHTHVNSRVSSLRLDHVQPDAEPDLPHVVIGIPAIQHNLLTPQSPSLIPSCCSPSEAQAGPRLTGLQPSKAPGDAFNVLKRIPSRDRKTFSPGQHTSTFSVQTGTRVSSI